MVYLTSCVVLALRFWPASAPSDLAHDHPNLPAGHPLSASALGSGPTSSRPDCGRPAQGVAKRIGVLNSRIAATHLSQSLVWFAKNTLHKHMFMYYILRTVNHLISARGPDVPIAR